MLTEAMQKPPVKYRTHFEFAKAVFPKEANPEKIWQFIRLGQKGQPRGVSIEEAYSMAKALDEKIDRLLLKAEMLIEGGWTLEQDIFESPQAKKPGRPPKNESKKNQPSISKDICITESTNIAQSEYGP